MIEKATNRKILFGTFILSALVMLQGCTTVHEVPIRDIQLPLVTEKLNIPVTLIITKEFRSAQSKETVGGGVRIVPIGKNLVHHSKRLMENVFMNSSILIHEKSPQPSDK